MKRLVLVAAAAVLAAVSAAAISTPASANAIVMRQTFTMSGPGETGLTDGCHPGATGAITGTDTVSYQSVETANGFHVEGTDVASGRIDWSDGSYTIIGSTDHFAFNATAGTTVSGEAHVDFGDNYSADGVFLGHITFHAVSHLTVTNGVIIRVSFEFNHQHVFGGDCSP
jgi:hypothetical protein